MIGVPRVRCRAINPSLWTNSHLKCRIVHFEELHYWSELAGSEAGRSYCIYTGAESQNRTLVFVLKWQDIKHVNEIFEQ